MECTLWSCQDLQRKMKPDPLLVLTVAGRSRPGIRKNGLPPESPRSLTLPLATIGCIVIGCLLWKRSRAAAAFIFAIGLPAMMVSGLRYDVPIGSRAELTQDAARDVTYSLLHNIYRAFDYRDESTVYDVLARSASGELLNEIYLQTRQSLTLASQGGAKVKVTDVDLIECHASAGGDDAWVADCTWNVTGSVGHWGHIHQRSNQYRGKLLIRSIDDQWKITEMQVLDESQGPVKTSLRKF